MREETRVRLDALMAKYEARRAEVQKRQAHVRERQDVFVAEFERLIQEVIRPVMEDIGMALRQRKHDYQIATTQGHSDSDGKFHETQVTMKIFPAEIDRSLFTSTTTPYVAFVSDRHQMRISVHESTSTAAKGGQSGQKTTFLARQLTPQKVEREILEVLAGVFGR